MYSNLLPLIIGSKSVGLIIFFLCDLGGYFDDDFAIPCGIAFMELERDQPEVNFNFCKVHFCLEINFVILHCSVNLESVILAAFCG